MIGSELDAAKPHPRPYLAALERLGGDASRSVGFEDSPSGACSAAAAGLGVVGLLTSVAAADLVAAGAHLTAGAFDDPALLQFVGSRTGAAPMD